jgi:hypothetical protein
MIFEVVKADLVQRLLELRAHLALLSGMEPDNPLEALSLEAKILNGLSYVMAYALIEKTANEVIRRLLESIDSKAVSNVHLTLTVNSVALHPKFKGLRESSTNLLVKANDIFACVRSSEKPRIDSTCLSPYMQNVDGNTFDALFAAFGIKGVRITPRLRTTLAEIRDKRNSVAHGREPVTVVGERFRSPVLTGKALEISDFLHEFIDAVESYHSNFKYIKSRNREAYR